MARRWHQQYPDIFDQAIRIGEDENTVILKKAEWNVLVEAIQSG